MISPLCLSQMVAGKGDPKAGRRAAPPQGAAVTPSPATLLSPAALLHSLCALRLSRAPPFEEHTPRHRLLHSVRRAAKFKASAPTTFIRRGGGSPPLGSPLQA